MAEEKETTPVTTAENSAESTEKPEESATKPTELPKLSAGDFRMYNRMAEVMDAYHNHFRMTWTMMYSACTTGKRPAGMSIRQFLRMAGDFCSHISAHHGIEEAHIFPILARKMPAFRKELELLTQHKQIHTGIERLEDYVGQCRSGEADFRLSDLKVILDSFGDVLWAHLEDEVKQLGAENMRKYWSLQEMENMPF